MTTSHLDTYWEFLRKDARIPLFIIAVLGLLIIYCLWQMVMTFTSSQQLPSFTNGTALIAHTTQNIPTLHLFGQYNQTLKDLPQTSLQLDLEGISLAVTPGGISRAIIATPNQPTKIYKVGDSVPGGAIIRHIFRDRVILDDNGRLESLKLPVPKITGTITKVAR